MKISVLCCSAFLLNKHLQIHLGVLFVFGEMLGVTSGFGVKVVPGESFFMQLLVFETGLLVCVTVSMLTVAVAVSSCSTNHERQLAGLFLTPEIHVNDMLYVVSSRLHLLTLLLVFFPFTNLARGL